MARTKKKVAKKKVATKKIVEVVAKRNYSKRRTPVYNDTEFKFKVEDFLPSSRKEFKPALKNAIIKATAELKVGQSIFLPSTELSIATLRALMKEELKSSFYKNRDIRVVQSNHAELDGARIARYL